MSKKQLNRKFMVEELPKDIKEYTKEEIEESFTSFSFPRTKIQKINNKFKLKMTDNEGTLEGAISSERYEELKKDSISNELIKARYTNNILIGKKSYMLVIDKYKSINDLTLVNIRFDNTEDSANFDKHIPNWFGEEVTGIVKLQTQNLACLDILKENGAVNF